ncbi:hypothetical protein KDH_00750 [Dictyobacter sp. S3.2.2.5]|uniref:Uncharacterized protein n=1 Tax=Dictyobacter halimunensis TaxID=3026934 RepID=A0ABQ6FLG0_9CHLR|nr:hypothetical protein KDH_00750 [Dictyobacter sp. S3.2.2.5]
MGKSLLVLRLVRLMQEDMANTELPEDILERDERCKKKGSTQQDAATEERRAEGERPAAPILVGTRVWMRYEGTIGHLSQIWLVRSRRMLWICQQVRRTARYLHVVAGG